MNHVDKALLFSEFAVLVRPRGRGVYEICPVCCCFDPPRTHDTDCAMDLALSERGYRTQEERDRARYVLCKDTEVAGVQKVGPA